MDKTYSIFEREFIICLHITEKKKYTIIFTIDASFLQLFINKSYSFRKNHPEVPPAFFERLTWLRSFNH